MGVSLGNKAFNGRFARNFVQYAVGQNCSKVVVFLGDFIERINYVTFSNYEEDRAVGVSLGRAENLRTMFLKSIRSVDIADVEIQIVLESEIRRDIVYHADIDDARLCLNACMSKKAFRIDLKRQLFQNLGAKVDRFGENFVGERSHYLEGYIIGELEIFYALYKRFGSVVELYPGREMVVKQRFFEGFYGCDRCPGLPLDYEYIDIASLASDRVGVAE